MKAEPTTDRFDQVPENSSRLGAHRRPRSKSAGWLQFGAAAVATIALTIGGIYLIDRVDSNLLEQITAGDTQERYIPEKPKYEVPIVEAKKDKKIDVTVLNGSTKSGLSLNVGQKLSKSGWKIVTRANADRDDIEKSTVYYNNLNAEAAARALAAELKIEAVQLATRFQGSPITLVLGQDQAN